MPSPARDGKAAYHRGHLDSALNNMLNSKLHSLTKDFCAPIRSDQEPMMGSLARLRGAQKQFQQSLGASPSGLLSNEQKTALLERPGEREARVARLAAEAKAKQDAANDAIFDMQ
jgi:hypothetical protein